MGTEMAVESDPRLAGLGTEWAWKETGIAGSISRRPSSLLGLLDLCVAPLHGVSAEGSPSSPVMSAGLKLLGGNFCTTYAALSPVFESLERPALFSLPRSELPKHQFCFGSLLSSMWMTIMSNTKTKLDINTQSQYSTNTGSASPSADPIRSGGQQGSHWSANF